MRIRHFHVRPNIPKELASLEEIARNLWFSWSWEAVQLFIRLNPVLWFPRRLPRERLWTYGTGGRE